MSKKTRTKPLLKSLREMEARGEAELACDALVWFTDAGIAAMAKSNGGKVPEGMEAGKVWEIRGNELYRNETGSDDGNCDLCGMGPECSCYGQHSSQA